MPVSIKISYQIRAYNASGDQLYLNGADADSYMHRTFPNYREALEYVISAPKSAFRWTDDGFKRNRVASFDMRPVDPTQGNIEPMSREDAVAALAWLNRLREIDAMPREIEETETVTETPKPKPAKRTTEVVHPDGTTSTRKSETMDYTHAIECKEDMHAKAKGARAKAEELVEMLAALERAVEAGAIESKSEPWTQGRTYTDFYAVDEVSGQRVHLGSEIRRKDGSLDKSTGREFILESAVAVTRSGFKSSHAAALQRAEQMEAGPQYTYGVIRWSQSLANANKAMGEFVGRVGDMTFRVVEAHEAAPKARKAAASKPAKAPAAAKPKTALDRAKAANAAALKALLGE